MRKQFLTRDEKKAIPFIIPGVLVTTLLIVYPLFYILKMSFTEQSTDAFVGLYNYIRLLKNPQFSKAMANTMKWTLSTVSISFILGSIYAFLINRKGIKFKGFWRSGIFMAWIIPGVVKATAWKWLLTTDGGMFNNILINLGVIREAVPWLTSQKFAMLSLIIVQIWACSPYVMLMMTAGLQQVPKDLYESADLDGSTWYQKIWYITFPMLKHISFICILMLFVWAINEFSLIWIMTSGGQNTSTLSLLVYNQFKTLNLNAASASAMMQLIITMVFAILYVKFSVKED